MKKLINVVYPMNDVFITHSLYSLSAIFAGSFGPMLSNLYDTSVKLAIQPIFLKYYNTLSFIWVFRFEFFYG